MSSFLSGLVGGGSKIASDRLNSGKPGLLGKLRKKSSGSSTPSNSDSGSNGIRYAPPLNAPVASPIQAKHGARKVKKTGWMKVHKNERVLTSKQAKRSRRRDRGGKI